MDKLDKDDAGYQHKSGTEYTCGDCIAFLDKQQRCALIYDQESVVSNDGCTYFMKGSAGQLVTVQPMLSRLDADFSRSSYGFSCKRCIHWSPGEWDCEVVNKASLGADSGMIHPDACCNLQELDSVRGFMPDLRESMVLNEPNR